jgi:polyferredoxin
MAFASAENHTNTSEIQAEMNRSFCGPSNFIENSNFAENIAVVMIIMTVLFVAVDESIVFLGTKWWLSDHNKKNPDAKLRMKDFMKFPWVVKLIILFFAVPPLLFMLLMIAFVILWFFSFSMMASIFSRFVCPLQTA